MSSPSLRDVQQWFQSRIGPQPVSGAAEPDLLNAKRGTPGAVRLTVYAGGYAARIRQALAEVYPALAHVLGRQDFTALAGDYAGAHPSREYNLSFAGRHLPDFLATWPRTEDLPFLPDLARLEWLVCLAVHAFDHPALDPSALGRMSSGRWEDLRFVFQPFVGAVTSSWPILDIWTARTRPRDAIAIDVVHRPQRVLVSRQGVAVRCALLEPSQYEVLAALLAGRTLGEACGQLADSGADGTPPVAAWFSAWARQGLFSALQPDRSSVH